MAISSAVLYPGKTERRSWSSGMRISLRQTTGGMVHSKIILSYKGTPFFEGIVPGPMEAIEIPSGSLPPPFRELRHN